MTVTPSFASWNAAMTASLKVFWNDEPAPSRVPERLPPLPPFVLLGDLALSLLPHAASARARATTTTSRRAGLWVAFKGISSGRGTRETLLSTRMIVRTRDRSEFTLV